MKESGGSPSCIHRDERCRMCPRKVRYSPRGNVRRAHVIVGEGGEGDVEREGGSGRSDMAPLGTLYIRMDPRSITSARCVQDRHLLLSFVALRDLKLNLSKTKLSTLPSSPSLAPHLTFSSQHMTPASTQLRKVSAACATSKTPPFPSLPPASVISKSGQFSLPNPVGIFPFSAAPQPHPGIGLLSEASTNPCTLAELFWKYQAPPRGPETHKHARSSLARISRPDFVTCFSAWFPMARRFGRLGTIAQCPETLLVVTIGGTRYRPSSV